MRPNPPLRLARYSARLRGQLISNVSRKNMDIVAIEKNSNITLQLAERTEDVQLRAHPSVPRFSEDTVWETPDRRFRYRPSLNTTEHFLLVCGKTYSVISDGISPSVLSTLLPDEEVLHRLFERGYITKRHEDDKKVLPSHAADAHKPRR